MLAVQCRRDRDLSVLSALLLACLCHIAENVCTFSSQITVSISSVGALATETHAPEVSPRWRCGMFRCIKRVLVTLRYM